MSSSFLSRSGRGTVMRALLSAAFGLALHPVAQADPIAEPSAWFIQYGNADETHAFTAGTTWDWERRWNFAGGIVTGYWEASLGLFRVDDPPRGRYRHIVDLGFTPVFRYRGSETGRWFGEAAIGLHWIAPRYAGNGRRFGTNFNFGDHLAVGYCLDARCGQEIALRVQHFSNGGFRKPNPGEDFIQLRYQRSFGLD